MTTTGDLARTFGKSNNAIKGWIKKHSVYFSEAAQGIGNRNRTFNENDILLIGTINSLVNEGLNHDAIGKRLADGYITKDIGRDVIPVSDAKQIVDASVIRQELEFVKTERLRLIDERNTYKNKVDKLTEEIKQLTKELGLAEGELHYRRQQDKD